MPLLSCRKPNNYYHFYQPIARREKEKCGHESPVHLKTICLGIPDFPCQKIVPRQGELSAAICNGRRTTDEDVQFCGGQG